MKMDEKGPTLKTVQADSANQPLCWMTKVYLVLSGKGKGIFQMSGEL
jgi:hypothetical protein